MIAEIERTQVSDLESLVGKIANPPRIEEYRNQIVALQRGVHYLQDQIKQRDLMLEDCYTTLTENKIEIDRLKKELEKCLS